VSRVRGPVLALLALFAASRAGAAETVFADRPVKDWGADTGLQVSVRWGWAGADLSQVSGALWDAGRDQAAAAAAEGAARGANITTVTKADAPRGGNSVGFDACWLIPPEEGYTAFGPGIRVHLMGASTRVEMNATDPGGNRTVTWASWADTRLVRLMGGLWARGGRPDTGYVRAGFLAGETFALARIGERRDSLVAGLPSYWYEYPFEGMGFTAELVCELGLRLNDRFSVFLEIGYHFAEIARMKWGRDLDMDGDGIPERKAGDVFTFPSRMSTSFDFTGSQADLGLRYGF